MAADDPAPQGGVRRDEVERAWPRLPTGEVSRETRLAAALGAVLAELALPADLDLTDTPRRWARALLDATAGHRADPSSLIKVFEERDTEGLVGVAGVPYYSTCAHHVLPFSGRAWVLYAPKGARIVGLSKIPRLIRACAAKLQTQERLTREIAVRLYQHTGLEPRGVGVFLTGVHTCCAGRGVRAPGVMATSHVEGVVTEDALSAWVQTVQAVETTA